MYRTTKRVFVVTRSRQDSEPLRIEFEYQLARAYVLAFNRISQTGKAVIRPGTADIRYSKSREAVAS